MKRLEQKILIATNGSREGEEAVGYGLWLAGLLQSKVVLLGIQERQSSRAKIETILAKAQSEDRSGLIEETLILKGQAEKILVERGQGGNYLVVVGPVGRPLWLRWLRGRSYRRILHRISSPMIYTRHAKFQIENILICMGGLGYANCAESWALHLAQQSGARTTLLHVVEPIQYDYPTTARIKASGDEIVESDTPQGRNLRAALEEAREAGVACQLKVRHGEIISEIRAEIDSQAYDLVAMGTAESSNSLRHLFLPNVTAEIAESSPIPVLTARPGQEPRI